MPSDAAPAFTDAQIAAFTNYEALGFGLPPFMQAALVIRVEGRIDSPDFRVTHTLEPFSHLYPWTVYTRRGALLTVGDAVMRLNRQQWQLWGALDAFAAAGADVKQRLLAWSGFDRALHMPGSNYVVVQGHMSHLRIAFTDRFPPRAMTRIGRQLYAARDIEGAAWAMEAGRRYYIRRG